MFHPLSPGNILITARGIGLTPRGAASDWGWNRCGWRSRWAAGRSAACAVSKASWKNCAMSRRPLAGGGTSTLHSSAANSTVESGLSERRDVPARIGNRQVRLERGRSPRVSPAGCPNSRHHPNVRNAEPGHARNAATRIPAPVRPRLNGCCSLWRNLVRSADDPRADFARYAISLRNAPTGVT